MIDTLAEVTVLPVAPGPAGSATRTPTSTCGLSGGGRTGANRQRLRLGPGEGRVVVQEDRLCQGEQVNGYRMPRAMSRSIVSPPTTPLAVRPRAVQVVGRCRQEPDRRESAVVAATAVPMHHRRPRSVLRPIQPSMPYASSSTRNHHSLNSSCRSAARRSIEPRPRRIADLQQPGEAQHPLGAVHPGHACSSQRDRQHTASSTARASG